MDFTFFESFNSNLFYYPMSLMVLWIGCVGVLSFQARKGAIKNKELPAKYFKTYTGQVPSEKVIVLGRHYDNQFQLPLLFMISCLAVIQAGQANELTLALAWIFVLSRGVHSYIHLGYNYPLHRAMAYSLGLIAIILIWIFIIFS